MTQSNEMVNTQVNAGLALLNGGYLRAYDGTAPATANTPVSTQTLGAEWRYGSPAFGAASAGSAIATAMAPTTASAAITPTWFRAFQSDGITPVLDGTAGIGNTDLVLSSASITVGQTVSVLSHTYTLPKH